ncbi:glucosaminidase domain-containing protein [Neolewinella persica]|uniref:glucosaminidase domain-containing protein n=1 Tax=Neolewinella persica TaxID=70998 RepID=UPI0003805877|nr:glucosaminidase domain-containing protein [Neolewinella persica]
MIKYIFTSLLLLSSLGIATAATPEVLLDEVMTSSVVDQAEYIKRYKEVAMREMERTGVPASIKLAQGLLESDSGKSRLARSANNHFGIKCGSQWNGDTYFKEDDDYNEQGRLVKSCFRQYRNAEASFVAHSEFLRDPAKSFRYGFLFRLDPVDYKAWAEGLRRSGYATNPDYPKLLISLIERYNLNQYDQSSVVVETPEVVLEPIAELQRGILRTNDVSYFVNDAPISVQDIARQVDVSVSRLLDYNEGLLQQNQNVDSGDRVYLQKKRNAYRGYEKYHVVEEGENLYDIAQRYALKLEKLAKRNRLRENSDPATGERIKLRGSKVKELVRLEGERDPNAPTNNVPTGDDGRILIDDPTDTNTQPTVPRPGTNVPTTTTPRPTTPPTTNPSPIPPVVLPPAVTNPPGQPTTTPTNTTEQFHSVSAGETLYAISRRYGLTVDALKQLNRLTGNTISIGQRLRVR